MRILCIDPGLGGAVGLIDTSANITSVQDLPTDDGSIDGSELSRIVRKINPDYAVVELVGYMPGDGGKGAFTFGHVAGTIRGVLDACSIPVCLVAPQVWKGALGLTGRGKEASVELALKLFPAMRPVFVGPRGGLKIDRAEAMLIGYWFYATQSAALESGSPPTKVTYSRPRRSKAPTRAKKARRQAREKVPEKKPTSPARRRPTAR